MHFRSRASIFVSFSSQVFTRSSFSDLRSLRFFSKLAIRSSLFLISLLALSNWYCWSWLPFAALCNSVSSSAILLWVDINSLLACCNPSVLSWYTVSTLFSCSLSERSSYWRLFLSFRSASFSLSISSDFSFKDSISARSSSSLLNLDCFWLVSSNFSWSFSFWMATLSLALFFRSCLSESISLRQYSMVTSFSVISRLNTSVLVFISVTCLTTSFETSSFLLRASTSWSLRSSFSLFASANWSSNLETVERSEVFTYSRSDRSFSVDLLLSPSSLIFCSKEWMSSSSAVFLSLLCS